MNDKYIKICDYLQNDYYGAVASCIEIKDNISNYAFICDCGVIVYDSNGIVKFQTEDEKELYSDPYINKIGISWNKPEARVIVRRDYRNNLNNIQDDKYVSYGAITSEKNANSFIRTGTVNLSKGDIIVVYSDGFNNFLYNDNFITHLLNFNKDNFEKYINEVSLSNYDIYGKEKTIIIFKY